MGRSVLIAPMVAVMLLAACTSAPGPANSPTSPTTSGPSVPATLGPADAAAARRIVLASPELRTLAGSVSYAVTGTAPGSAGTVPDKFLPSVTIQLAHAVAMPAGLPILIARGETDPPLPLASATTVSTGSVPPRVSVVDFLVDLSASRVFAVLAR